MAIFSTGRLPAVQNTDELNYKRLLKNLNSQNNTQRSEAMKRVRQLDSVELTQLVQQAATSYRWNWSRYLLSNPAFWCIIGIPIIFLLFWLVGQIWPSAIEAIYNKYFRVTLSLIVVSMFYQMFTDPNRLYNSLRRVLAEKPDATGLGLLLDLHRQETLPSMNEERNMPKQLLVPIIEQRMKQMQSGDYADLTAAQKQTLLAFLKRPYERPNLTLALLDALKSITDESAVNAIKGLMTRTKLSQTGYEIWKAAQDCLVAMLQARAEEQTSQTLVRASSAETGSSSDTLLRPVASSDSAAPEQLLRAVASADQ